MATLPVPARPDDGLDLTRRVVAWREAVTIETYEVAEPDAYPEFLENRVYQGSSGRVYPLQFHERIESERRPHTWDAIHVENEYLRIMILPELGGRLHMAFDKTNGYDFFYRNNVIKPALVGLAGPWISGGIEFNWPQHHRPGTYLPTTATIEEESDGAVTVWCSDHDPFARMKGMHGIRIRPGSSLIEARVRLFNRTEDVQTFLWWANVAAAVNDDYQSFFPTDVHAVADHAKRDVTSFPAATGLYYGIDYASRVDAEHPDADHIDWYRNIPVPTSYMCLGTQDDFFGGYDHGRKAGFVHVADHHLAPGKKQWTWGDDEFGHAWDRNLTDGDGPYVELMAGVYTDNQPDFTFLAPGETKTFSQFWYPLREIGVAHQASTQCAVSLEIASTGDVRLARVGVVTTSEHDALPIRLVLHGDVDGSEVELWSGSPAISPALPFTADCPLPDGVALEDLEVRIGEGLGESGLMLAWRPRPAVEEASAADALPDPATEPPAPCEIASSDELFTTGLHLDQYRHATRSPEPYWQEALSRDPLDYRCNVAMASRRYRTGDHLGAEAFLRLAIQRATRRNPNPYDGEAYYRLGIVLTHLGRAREAYDALSKSLWNAAWRAPAHVALARLDAAAGRWADALEHADSALRVEGENLQALAIKVIALRSVGADRAASEVLAGALGLDPLDSWLADLATGEPLGDPQTWLDVALEYVSLGCWGDALRVLDGAADFAKRLQVPGQANPAPLIEYHRADVLAALHGSWAHADVVDALSRAATVEDRYCLAGRIADADMLGRVVEHRSTDAKALTLLGHWLYFHRRYEEAMGCWERAARAGSGDPVVWRCLGVAEYNVRRDAQTALECYAKARALAPDDSKLLYESDQLAKRVGVTPVDRAAAFASSLELIPRRDDLVAEYAELLTLLGKPQEALEALAFREFHPWEGGEGRVLGVWDATHLALARTALRTGEPERAVAAMRSAFATPASLGEARYILANSAELCLMLGDALDASGDREAAVEAWRKAADQVGDFRAMASVPFSEMTYFSILAAVRLGDEAVAQALAEGLAGYVAELRTSVPTVDYFATSLPSMLLFRADLVAEQDVRIQVIEAQLNLVAGRRSEAQSALFEVLRKDPSHALARRLSEELA